MTLKRKISADSKEVRVVETALTKLFNGNAHDVLDSLISDGIEVDSIIIDPPYGLNSRELPDFRDVVPYWERGEEYPISGSGFMGKDWDAFVMGGIYKKAITVLPPGGYIAVFTSPKMSYLTGLALTLAGFEMRNSISWIYGNGFPKSLNIDREFERNPKLSSSAAAQLFAGYGTDLKPAHELILVARKPLSEKTYLENLLKHGAGCLNIDKARIAGKDTRKITSGAPSGSGFGTKPGAIAGSALGRFPANVVHDGSPGVIQLFDSQQAPTKSTNPTEVSGIGGIFGKTKKSSKPCSPGFDDKGSVGRYFKSCDWALEDLPPFLYCRKPSKSERNKGISKSEKASGNTHCTVKPISLMKYLCTLFGHEGGTILDFTSGSGSTGIGALQAGMKFIGVELSREYFDIAVDRITFEEKKSLKIEIPNRENIPAYTKHLKSEIHFLLRLIESEKTNRKPTDDLALKLRIKVQELEQYIKGSKAA